MSFERKWGRTTGSADLKLVSYIIYECLFVATFLAVLRPGMVRRRKTHLHVSSVSFTRCLVFTSGVAVVTIGASSPLIG